MRVALVVHQFPSPEHPYIFEWVHELLAQDLNLVVLTEKLAALPNSEFWTSRENVWRHVRQINSIDHPSLQLFLHGLLTILQYPKRFLRLFRVLNASDGPKGLSVLRKLFEYLPLLSEEFDLIHFNAPQIAERRFELKEFFGAVSLVSFRGQDFTYYPDRYDYLLREADHLHFISQFLVEQAMQRGYDGTRHTLIYPMVDTDFYTSVPRPQDMDSIFPQSLTLFSAARLEWVKGWEFALQAVALLLECGWDLHYYIAGDGDFKDLLVYTIDQLGIAERVHLLGWQSPEQVRDWMHKADMYLMTSVSEAFNNSVLQAQACGLPVVCSDEGGLPENIVDGVTGLLARCRDAWDTAKKIEMLIPDIEKRKLMGKAGYERVRKEFAVQTTVRRFVEIYEHMVS